MQKYPIDAYKYTCMYFTRVNSRGIGSFISNAEKHTEAEVFRCLVIVWTSQVVKLPGKAWWFDLMRLLNKSVQQVGINRTENTKG